VARNNFYAVINDAVRDFTVHGFDSQARLERWLAAIEAAAGSVFLPAHVVQARIADHLERIFARTVARPSQLLRVHPGVSVFTLQQIAPRLRLELNRRILASANLIVFGRRASKQRTLQRFTGWATSIPAGGSHAVDKAEEAEKVRRGIAGLAHEESRVIIDQGHKLVSAIHDIIAVDGGALGGYWKHVHRGLPDYDARPQHVAWDKRHAFFVIRDNWALKRGLIKLDGHQYTDQIEAPGFLVFCFPGESRIPFADRVEMAYRRWYSGELTELITASGKTLRATPNHPVLTLSGWKPIGSIQEGDEVVEVPQQSLWAAGKDQYDRIVPMIQDVFGTLQELGISESLCTEPASFHGDGADGYVDAVAATRRLSIDWQAELPQRLDEFALAKADHKFSLGGNRGPLRFGVLAAFKKVMRAVSNLAATFRSQMLHAYGAGFGVPAQFNTGLIEPVYNCSAAHLESFGQGQDTFAGLVGSHDSSNVNVESGMVAPELVEAAFFDRLERGHGADAKDIGELLQRFPFRAQLTKAVKIKTNSWSGHVYNLQVKSGWYVTEGIITKNCSCHYEYVYALRDVPDGMLTGAGKAELARVRAAINA
jgi:hypothetical protein